MSNINILLVEDNESDAKLIKEAFLSAELDCKISIVIDGQKAEEFMFKQGKYADECSPDAIILDLKLPKKGGMEVLKDIRGKDEYKDLPIIMLTNSEAKTDILESYENHVSAYITKPLVMNELVNVVKYIYDTWLSKLDK